MNNKQLAVLWVGLGLIVLMCLFPPWVYLQENYGYYCLFTPPAWISGLQPRLDISRLVVQCVAVALLTGAGIYTLRTKGK